LDYQTAYSELLKHARELAAQLDEPPTHETEGKRAVNLLVVAWRQAVFADWQAYLDANPQFAEVRKLASVLVAQRYIDQQDCLVAPPGMVAPIVRLEGGDAICVDQLLGSVYPLSAVYFSKARDILYAVELAKGSKDTQDAAA